MAKDSRTRQKWQIERAKSRGTPATRAAAFAMFTPVGWIAPRPGACACNTYSADVCAVECEIGRRWRLANPPKPESLDKIRARIAAGNVSHCAEYPTKFEPESPHGSDAPAGSPTPSQSNRLPAGPRHHNRNGVTNA